MQSISSLVKALQVDFPQLTFEESATSRWSYENQTVYYNPHEEHAEWILLHELGHALLQHKEYHRDIELLTMERDAWHHATELLASQYQLVVASDFIEDHLDTYRDWLHAKSTCPHCSLTGVEVRRHEYRCYNCHHTWKTNEGTYTRIYRRSK